MTPRLPRLALRPSLPLLSLLLVLAPLAACTASEEKVAAMASQAQALLDSGQPREAQALIQGALKQRDDMPAVYLVQAHIALALNKRAEAYQAFSNALALEATNPEALLGVANTGVSTGHLDEAERAADKILVLSPGQTDAMLVKGIVKMVRNDLDAAIGFADKVLALKPSDIGALVLKSRAMALQGDTAGALALLRGAVPRTGETLEMTMAIAELQRAGGDGDAFLASLRRIRELAPANRDYRFDMVDTLYKLGRTDEARSQAAALLAEPITDAAELGRFPRLWYGYDREGLTPGQVVALNGAATVEARLMLARFLIATGRAAEAAALLRPVATGWSSDVQGLFTRAGEAMGQVQPARDAADQMLDKRDPGNGDALLIRARAAMARRDPAAATVDLQRVVRDYPQWEEGYLALAQAQEAAGKRDGVRRVFEDGRKALPQSLPLAQAYAAALVRMGDGSHALDVARRFALDSPSLEAGWAFYGDICRRSGDEDCRAEVAAGTAKAKSRFGLDPAPGTPRAVALIGRLD